MPYMLELANLFQLSSKEIHRLLIKLHISTKDEDLIEHCRKIKKYEHELIIYMRSLYLNYLKLMMLYI